MTDPTIDDLGLPPEYPRMTRKKWLFFTSNKPYIVAKIIMGNKQIRLVTKEIDSKTSTIHVGNHAYSVAPEAIYTEKIGWKYKPVSYYYYDNPNPITWNRDMKAVVFNPKSFKDALDTKVIQDVLKPDMANLLLILVIVAAALSLIGLFVGGYSMIKIKTIADYLASLPIH